MKYTEAVEWDAAIKAYADTQGVAPTSDGVYYNSDHDAEDWGIVITPTLMLSTVRQAQTYYYGLEYRHNNGL